MGVCCSSHADADQFVDVASNKKSQSQPQPQSQLHPPIHAKSDVQLKSPQSPIRPRSQSEQISQFHAHAYALQLSKRPWDRIAGRAMSISLPHSQSVQSLHSDPMSRSIPSITPPISPPAHVAPILTSPILPQLTRITSLPIPKPKQHDIRQSSVPISQTQHIQSQSHSPSKSPSQSGIDMKHDHSLCGEGVICTYIQKTKSISQQSTSPLSYTYRRVPSITICTHRTPVCPRSAPTSPIARSGFQHDESRDEKKIKSNPNSKINTKNKIKHQTGSDGKKQISASSSSSSTFIRSHSIKEEKKQSSQKKQSSHRSRSQSVKGRSKRGEEKQKEKTKKGQAPYLSFFSPSQLLDASSTWLTSTYYHYHQCKNDVMNDVEIQHLAYECVEYVKQQYTLFLHHIEPHLTQQQILQRVLYDQYYYLPHTYSEQQPHLNYVDPMKSFLIKQLDADKDGLISLSDMCTSWNTMATQLQRHLVDAMYQLPGSHQQGESGCIIS